MFGTVPQLVVLDSYNIQQSMSSAAAEVLCAHRCGRRRRDERRGGRRRGGRRGRHVGVRAQRAARSRGGALGPPRPAYAAAAGPRPARLLRHARARFVPRARYPNL